MSAGIVLSTGIVIKVYRYGKYIDLDLAECSREELLELFQGLTKEELIRWMVSLIKGVGIHMAKRIDKDRLSCCAQLWSK